MGFFSNLFNSQVNNIVKSTPRNGFNFNYLSNEHIYLRNGNYNKSSIERVLKILKESGDLINTTKTPKVFFERYLLSISILNELISIEKKLSFKGNKPSSLKKTLQGKEVFTVNDFLDRYYNDTLAKINAYKTVKAKQNKVYEFSNEIDKYSRYMTLESLKKFTILYEQLENMFIKH